MFLHIVPPFLSFVLPRDTSILILKEPNQLFNTTSLLSLTLHMLRENKPANIMWILLLHTSHSLFPHKSRLPYKSITRLLSLLSQPRHNHLTYLLLMVHAPLDPVK